MNVEDESFLISVFLPSANPWMQFCLIYDEFPTSILFCLLILFLQYFMSIPFAKWKGACHKIVSCSNFFA